MNEGVMDAVGMRGTQKAKVRMVQQGDNKSTWYFTDQDRPGTAAARLESGSIPAPRLPAMKRN